jgi:hypothetical protein
MSLQTDEYAPAQVAHLRMTATECGRAPAAEYSEGPYTAPEYRVELFAPDAMHNQMLINLFSGLLGLPLRKTGQQAGDEVRRRYLKRVFQA